MNQLPPFSGDHPRCPKCRHKGASTEWRPHVRAVYGAAATPAKPEHLRRACLRCSYAWREAIAV